MFVRWFRPAQSGVRRDREGSLFEASGAKPTSGKQASRFRFHHPLQQKVTMFNRQPEDSLWQTERGAWTAPTTPGSQLEQGEGWCLALARAGDKGPQGGRVEPERGLPPARSPAAPRRGGALPPQRSQVPAPAAPRRATRRRGACAQRRRGARGSGRHASAGTASRLARRNSFLSRAPCSASTGPARSGHSLLLLPTLALLLAGQENTVSPSV